MPKLSLVCVCLRIIVVVVAIVVVVIIVAVVKINLYQDDHHQQQQQQPHRYDLSCLVLGHHGPHSRSFASIGPIYATQMHAARRTSITESLYTGVDNVLIKKV